MGHAVDPILAGPGESRAPGASTDARQLVSRQLERRLETLVADVADAPADVTRALVRMLAASIGAGRVDVRSPGIAELHRAASDRAVSIGLLFSAAYLTERAILDDLAGDEALGAATERWPLVAQLVRRASFDVLAALAGYLQEAPSPHALVDPLTTVHSRGLLDLVLAKELDRAWRTQAPFSLVLVDVDRLAEINAAHGSGVGDRILERLGILLRGFFRQHDWVTRYEDDAFAVLLTTADGALASSLAEELRRTIAARLELVDHRSGAPLRVTITALVVKVTVAQDGSRDPARLLIDADAALRRAKRQGRDRVVSLEWNQTSRSS
jgi:diguanylate cyclase (GGDEF)-like protein